MVPLEDENGFARPGRRFVAAIIDMALLSGLCWLMWSMFSQTFTEMLYTGSGFFTMLTLAVLVIPALYSILMHTLVGASVGQLCVGVRVIEVATAEKPILFAALLQYIISFLSVFSFGVGFLWVAFDSRRQSWANKLSGTVVVKKAYTDRRVANPSQDDIQLWSTGKLLVFVSLFVLLMVNIAWQYELPLNPDAIKDCTFSIKNHPGNTAFWELGAFGVEADKDPATVGYQRTTKFNEALQELYTSHDVWEEHEDILPDTGSDTLDVDINQLTSNSVGKDFFTYVRQNRAKIDSVFAKYAYLQPRYLKIMGYTSIKSNLFPDAVTPVPIYLPLVSYQRLWMQKIGSLYLDGDYEKAAQMLEQSFKVCDVLMEETDTLITKLVAIILYHLTQNTASELINYQTPINLQLANVTNNLKPLNLQARSFEKPLVSELQMGIATLVRVVDSPKSLADLDVSVSDIDNANPPFIKANQIFNYTWELTRNYVNLTKMDQAEFYKAYSHIPKPHIGFIQYINNPVGVVLATNKILGMYVHYFTKSQDIDIRTNVLKAAVAIKQQNLYPSQVQEFLNQSRTLYGNLYTGTPLHWDENSSTISFDGPYQDDNKDAREFSITFN